MKIATVYQTGPELTPAQLDDMQVMELWVSNDDNLHDPANGLQAFPDLNPAEQREVEARIPAAKRRNVTLVSFISGVASKAVILEGHARPPEEWGTIPTVAQKIDYLTRALQQMAKAEQAEPAKRPGNNNIFTQYNHERVVVLHNAPAKRM